MRHVTRFRKSIIIYLAIFILLVYLFFRYGVQLFVDTAFYLSGTKHDVSVSTTKSNNQQSAINVDPMLIDVPHATNEATLTLLGRANSGSKIYLYQNDQRIDTTLSDYDGNVQFLITLNPGENDLYIKSVDESTQKSTDSPVYQLVYLNKEPTLDISEPTDGKRVYQSDIVINGKTDAEVFITINGATVVVRADGTFSQPFTLQKGDNTITIRAQDVAANVTEKSLKVTFVQ